MPSRHVHPSRAASSRTKAHRASSTRDRIGRAATGAVSTAMQAGADRSDAADTMGHATADLAARAGMHAAGSAGHIMAKPVKKAVSAMRGKPGRPSRLSHARPSSRIAAAAARSKASRRIGGHVGKGAKSIGRGVKRLGSTGMGWADEASAKLTAADDDLASKTGETVRDLTFKAGRKGISSSARFIWRHRRAPVRAVHGAKSVGRAGVHGAKAAGHAGVRVARATATLIRLAASRIATGLTTMSLPIAPIAAALLVLLTMLIVVMGATMAGTANADAGVKGVPAEYESDVIRAGSICTLITPPVIAAQIEAESGWDPNAVSPVGATGIAQFMPGTWATSGKDGDGDGKADINNPHDQIWSEGNYMCSLAEQVESLKKTGRVSGDSLQLTIAAYNAGLGNVLAYGGIPPFTETRNYVARILALTAKYTASGGSAGGAGGTAGTLDKPLVTQSDRFHVDIAAMGIPATSTTYQVFQCTWWASVRRAQIGKPVDGYMGNGGQWNDSARRFGYPVSGSPKPGDVMVFEPGVHGSSPAYGHVAVVETVGKDGSVLISESGRGWMSVVTETISASELHAMRGGISFIH